MRAATHRKKLVEQAIGTCRELAGYACTEYDETAADLEAVRDEINNILERLEYDELDDAP